MTEWSLGKIATWQSLTPFLATFRLTAEPGRRFDSYEPGQYIALRRDHCRLTRLVFDPDGRPQYLPELDDSGQQMSGPVTHPYSIASAPFETAASGFLEFYVVLEIDRDGTRGRLSSSLFEMDGSGDDTLSYFHRMAGTFTLAKRARGFKSVLMVGTGTGVAPFVSMLKQLHHEGQRRDDLQVRYTLIHANRTPRGLAYHEDLLHIEAAKRFDFSYVPSVSRPVTADSSNLRLGRGRANNLLRQLFGMPLSPDPSGSATAPALPRNLNARALLQRLNPRETVLMTCGNPWSVADLRVIANAQGIAFETEDW